jgi:hypothetical protein
MANWNIRLQRAKMLGRVERLLGSDCNVNPYPEMSKEWEKFREGWIQPTNDHISRDFRTYEIKGRGKSTKVTVKQVTRDLVLRT